MGCSGPISVLEQILGCQGGFRPNVQDQWGQSLGQTMPHLTQQLFSQRMAHTVAPGADRRVGFVAAVAVLEPN